MVNDQQYTFLVELMVSATEKGLLSALETNPDDEASRNAYVDFLLERGRDKTAEWVREGNVPGSWKKSKALWEKEREAIKKAAGTIASGYIYPYSFTCGSIYIPPGGLALSGQSYTYGTASISNVSLCS